MAYVDFMANQTDARVPGFGLSNNSIGSPFLLPSFSGLIHSNPAGSLPSTLCSGCFIQCHPIHTYNGLCSNCHGQLLSSVPTLDQDVSDSFIMTSMMNVVDDVLREDKIEPIHSLRCTVCEMYQPNSLLCSKCQNHFCQSCFPQHSTNHSCTELGSDSISNPVSPKPTSHSAHSSQSPTSLFSDCSLDENDDEIKFECCDLHNEKIQYFCQSCTTLLCYSCISNGHQHHPHTTIREAYERITPSMENITSNANQKMKHLNVSVESATGMKEKIVRKKEEAVGKVQRMFQSYRETILRHEKDIIAQISILTDLRLKSLSKDKENDEKILKNLRELHKNMSNSKDNRMKASSILMYHKISKCIDNGADSQFSSVPIEDDSFIIKENNSNIRESLKNLCIVTTAPYPPFCSAMGEGLFHPRVGRVTTIVVTTKDRRGEPCTEGGEQLMISFRAMCDSLIKVDVRDNQDGSYSLSFCPRVKGHHQLSICIRGHHIKGSPFKLDVDGGREYNHFGVVTNIFGREGNKPGQFCRPWGIACDQKGHIIVGDRSNHRVQVFNSNGVLITMFGSEGTGNGQFNRPAGVATTREGHIVVADKDNHRIQVFTIDGTFLFKFGSKGGNDNQMIYPYDVAVNQKDGRIAVTDTGNHRLLTFTSDGHLDGKFGYKGYLCGHFDSPRGIAFNDDGHIIVSDFNVHHILVIHPDGTTARILGSQGIGNGQFMRPQGVSIDHMGNFVIADTRNNRIVIMHPSGQFIAKFGVTGSGQGHLDRPTSVCVLPDGRIGVVDFGNSRIQIF